MPLKTPNAAWAYFCDDVEDNAVGKVARVSQPIVVVVEAIVVVVEEHVPFMPHSAHWVTDSAQQYVLQLLDKHSEFELHLIPAPDLVGDPVASAARNSVSSSVIRSCVHPLGASHGIG